MVLSACDLVDGTPVLDVKVCAMAIATVCCPSLTTIHLTMIHPVSQPYVPHYDSVQPCRVPAWILETIHTRNTVTFRYVDEQRLPTRPSCPLMNSVVCRRTFRSHFIS